MIEDAGVRAVGFGGLLRGSGDSVSKVISTLIGIISGYIYRYLNYKPTY